MSLLHYIWVFKKCLFPKLLIKDLHSYLLNNYGDLLLPLPEFIELNIRKKSIMKMVPELLRCKDMTDEMAKSITHVLIHTPFTGNKPIPVILIPYLNDSILYYLGKMVPFDLLKRLKHTKMFDSRMFEEGVKRQSCEMEISFSDAVRRLKWPTNENPLCLYLRYN